MDLSETIHSFIQKLLSVFYFVPDTTVSARATGIDETYTLQMMRLQ